MTVTSLGTVSVGATLTCAASAAAAIDVAVGMTLPEVTAKLSGYLLAQIPSPSFDMGAQVALCANALVSAQAELAALPGGVGVALAATLSAAIAAQLAAQLAVKAVSPSVALKIDAALAGAAALNVQASAGVSGPNINLALIASKVAELGAIMAALEAQLAIAAELTASLGVGGLTLYRFDGDLALAGAELQAQIAADGISGEAHFVLMLPRNAAAWGALQATVKTS